jgi:hypothetical protein
MVPAPTGCRAPANPNPLLPHATKRRVPVVTLDAFAASRNCLPSWSLMDVEGWEIAALRGARQVLTHVQVAVGMHPSAWEWSGHSTPASPALPWTREHKGGGRVFFTTLGYPDDFSQESMRRLVVNGILWALGTSRQAAPTRRQSPRTSRPRASICPRCKGPFPERPVAKGQGAPSAGCPRTGRGGIAVSRRESVEAGSARLESKYGGAP